MQYPGHSLAGVLPLCREAVGVFYSPNRLGLTVKCNIQDTRWLGSYLSAEKQSVYSTVPTDWAWPLSAISRTLAGWRLTLLERSSRCILVSTNWAWSLSAISRTVVDWGLTPLDRSSRCFLQPQLSGHTFNLILSKLSNTLIELFE